MTIKLSFCLLLVPVDLWPPQTKGDEVKEGEQEPAPVLTWVYTCLLETGVGALVLYHIRSHTANRSQLPTFNGNAFPGFDHSSEMRREAKWSCQTNTVCWVTWACSQWSVHQTSNVWKSLADARAGGHERGENTSLSFSSSSADARQVGMIEGRIPHFCSLPVPCYFRRWDEGHRV